MFGKLLGEGSEGSVYAAWYLETPVAVKKTSSLAEVEISLHAGVCVLRGKRVYVGRGGCEENGLFGRGKDQPARRYVDVGKVGTGGAKP